MQPIRYMWDDLREKQSENKRKRVENEVFQTFLRKSRRKHRLSYEIFEKRFGKQKAFRGSFRKFERAPRPRKTAGFSRLDIECAERMV